MGKENFYAVSALLLNT